MILVTVPNAEGHSAVPMLQLEAISKRLHDTVRGAIQNHAMLEVANKDEELIGLFNNSYEAAGLAAIRHALTQTLLMQVMRCWDKHGSDRASLPSLCERLSKPGITESVIEAGANWHPSLNRADGDREIVRRCLAELQAGVAVMLQGENDARLRRIRDFRHTYVAHNLTKEPDTLPQYQDVFGLLDDTWPLVRKAELGIGGHDTDYDDTRAIMEKQAVKFWTSIRRGQRTTVGLRLRRREELNRRLRDGA